MNFAISPSTITTAEQIPYVTADEAFDLMQTALDRFIRLIESLPTEEWSKPTACTEWNVRDMVAHQAGGFASGADYREMIHQLTARPKSRPGQLIEDSINALQLAERADMTPAELIVELRQAGKKASHNWAYGFRLVKWASIPHPIPGKLSMRHLMWVIHSRDTWMHRLDICRATGRHFEQTRAHDGRINELVVLDLARTLQKKLNGRAFTLVLTGVAGGTWQIGQGNSEAVIEMDTLDFNIYASGRFSYEEGISRAQFSGDNNLAGLAFKNFSVLY
ncbi:MAG: maleylpyruvate isomerase family mycothiol-dependent enzyme [Chloroflexi bacterium]|nr:maleylpyruvate isomerase family mycothiol-dependent enzyme [Ardenticatenaceae bacterium]MBL1130972.1 maleylpyruvate isomerase family mycothiol-dependent enzyme [Chloroflexota bacterium]NOG37071.1 maleylpyruvate isomerase family mycothiol-dependent enzyme [Chloroflexota bacterium]GIK57049.1 MAG: hypothetical protein BroJett015_27120 [Chloroflexota bacterium]